MLTIPIIFNAPKSGLQSFNCYVTENDGKLVLIDGGIQHPSFETYTENCLATHQLSFSDIDAIYLTHHHEDHIGLVKRVLKEKNVPIYIHSEAKPRLTFDGDFLNMRIQFFETFYKQMNCLEDAHSRLSTLRHTYKNRHKLRIDADYRIVDDSTQLGRFQVIPLPGHSTDSISFYDVKRKEMYAGDTVLKNTSTNAIIDPLANGTYVHANWQQRASLQKLATMDLETIYAGHQPIITDVAQTTLLKLKKLDQKAEKLKMLLKTPLTASEAAKAFYGPLYEKQFSLVLSEIVGQLHTLYRRGEIEATMKNGIYLFQSKV